jgi:hypothetical protein
MKFTLGFLAAAAAMFAALFLMANHYVEVEHG